MKILFIDDEADLVEVVSFRLRAAGFDVSAASNGPSGIEQARAQRPDLIILDLMMPGMDGFEVAKRLKVQVSTQAIPIVVLTAAVAPNMDDKVAEMCAQAHLTKPFEADELLTIVKRLLLGPAPK